MLISQNLRGSHIGDVAEFETDIIGKKNGLIKVKGTLTSGNWVINSLDVQIKNSLNEIE